MAPRRSTAASAFEPASRGGEGRRPRAPGWVEPAGRALAQAAREVRLIASNTPRNLREELDRLAPRWKRGDLVAPRFVYEPLGAQDRLRGALDELAGTLDREGPLGAIYAARARELSTELSMCEAAGGPGLWAAARRRYARRDRFDDQADATARSWLDERDDRAAGTPLVRSDDASDPSSLVSRLRQEIGRLKLPLRVIVSRNLASLAATGDGFVQVAEDRAVSRTDVERTVLHEIDGHVLPRLASLRERLGIFAIGTAHGSDDQEGRALAMERASGFLDWGRRREIALRHLAARRVEEGADFVATGRLLLEHGAPLHDTLRITARVHRGGGLAREAVYLPALLRVEAAIADEPAIDEVLAVGRVSVDAVKVLRAFVA